MSSVPRMAGSRDVRIEFIVNGRPVETRTLTADGTIRPVEADLLLPHSGWVAARILPSAHTNPIWVQVVRPGHAASPPERALVSRRPWISAGGRSATRSSRKSGRLPKPPTTGLGPSTSACSTKGSSDEASRTANSSPGACSSRSASPPSRRDTRRTGLLPARGKCRPTAGSGR